MSKSIKIDAASKDNMSFADWHAEIVRRAGRPFERDEAAMCGRQGYEEGLTIGAVLQALNDATI